MASCRLVNWQVGCQRPPADHAEKLILGSFEGALVCVLEMEVPKGAPCSAAALALQERQRRRQSGPGVTQYDLVCESFHPCKKWGFFFSVLVRCDSSLVVTPCGGLTVVSRSQRKDQKLLLAQRLHISHGSRIGHDVSIDLLGVNLEPSEADMIPMLNDMQTWLEGPSRADVVLAWGDFNIRCLCPEWALTETPQHQLSGKRNLQREILSLSDVDDIVKLIATPAGRKALLSLDPLSQLAELKSLQERGPPPALASYTPAVRLSAMWDFLPLASPSCDGDPGLPTYARTPGETLPAGAVADAGALRQLFFGMMPEQPEEGAEAGELLDETTLQRYVAIRGTLAGGSPARFLQLGWLDRAAWRLNAEDSPVRAHHLGQVAYGELTLSDHAVVVSELQLEW